MLGQAPLFDRRTSDGAGSGSRNQAGTDREAGRPEKMRWQVYLSLGSTEQPLASTPDNRGNEVQVTTVRKAVTVATVKSEKNLQNSRQSIN
ncbi:hypothetical protein B7O88_02625 [Halopseudomonas aestusnigri]|nr:hypothetical protein B7O88_02625 [Halopseudomonas aestusnigri]